MSTMNKENNNKKLTGLGLILFYLKTGLGLIN